MMSDGSCLSIQQLIQQSDSSKKRRRRLGKLHKNYRNFRAVPNGFLAYGRSGGAGFDSRAKKGLGPMLVKARGRCA
jgi:hypothetical protein